ncbi:protein of unknown function [Paenibacillus alvei]|uniref:Uncharacterized protein n=1 Tax=Paenibacillus alvei TaxID=44250 RepID=A0A383RHS1_PAEAL|nr:protein of unknown function [Paenibacillus alvei]
MGELDGDSLESRITLCTLYSVFSLSHLAGKKDVQSVCAEGETRIYIDIGQSRNGRDRIRESPVDFNRVEKYLKNITDHYGRKRFL